MLLSSCFSGNTSFCDISFCSFISDLSSVSIGSDTGSLIWFCTGVSSLLMGSSNCSGSSTATLFTSISSVDTFVGEATGVAFGTDVSDLS